MNELIVKKEEELFTFLKNNYIGSKNNIKSLLTRELVSVNGKTITQYNYLLKVNDKVSIGAKKVDSNIGRINILYEDNYYLVVDKPSGMLTIATEEDSDNSSNLYDILLRYVKKKSSSAKLFVVHRLDRDTSGVLLFAKNEELKNDLQDNWNEIAKRTYYAVVVGKTKDKEVLKSFLKENDKLMTYSSKDGKLAITEYERIKTNDKYSLLKINIKTGRRNQIRVQLRDINHPIAGDKKYGIKDKSIKRMMLHASRLEIINPIDKKKMIFESKYDKSFNKVLE